MSASLSRPLIIISCSAVLVLVASVFSVRGMMRVWGHSPKVLSRCNDLDYATALWRRQTPNAKPQTDPESDWQPDRVILIQSCIQMEMKSYVDTDYGQISDLAKAFLTLITATFVASISFSEKIVNIQTAPRASSIAMFISWLFLLLAIFACGTGLVMNLSSIYDLKYNWNSPSVFQSYGLLLFFGSGISFALGLTSMLIAALPNLTKSQAMELTPPPDDPESELC
jgi:hypothetical protein